MNRNHRKILRHRKHGIARRLAPQAWEDPPRPMFKASNIHYQMSERVHAVSCGGIGAMRLVVRRLGLVEDLNQNLKWLKAHPPHHESDHVLNSAYNILAGGARLEDIELRRRDENFLNGLEAQRLPDPTAAGDFTRRFEEADIPEWQECFNRARLAVWKVQPKGFLEGAFIDVGGTIAGTLGERQEGIGPSYKGIRGYAPLIVSLANTEEVLHLQNRPGNRASHSGSVEWIDRAVNLVGPVAGTVTIRGDTDFTPTAPLDRGDEAGRFFIPGTDAHPQVVQLAQALPQSAWQRLERPPRYAIPTEPRAKAFRYKERIGIEKELGNQKLTGEDIAEMDYQPLQCQRKCRLVIVRKNIGVQKGEKVLLDQIRYFFHLTHRKDKAAKIGGLANGRCDQENVMERLKNGVNAMRMPLNARLSNWAYMVMAAPAWNLKSWHGLLAPSRQRGLELVRMEFRRFLNAILLIPAQVGRAARRVIHRVLGCNHWLKGFFATWERLQRLVLAEWQPTRKPFEPGFTGAVSSVPMKNGRNPAVEPRRVMEIGDESCAGRNFR